MARAVGVAIRRRRAGEPRRTFRFRGLVVRDRTSTMRRRPAATAAAVRRSALDANSAGESTVTDWSYSAGVPELTSPPGVGHGVRGPRSAMLPYSCSPVASCPGECVPARVCRRRCAAGVSRGVIAVREPGRCGDQSPGRGPGGGRASTRRSNRIPLAGRNAVEDSTSLLLRRRPSVGVVHRGHGDRDCGDRGDERTVARTVRKGVDAVQLSVGVRNEPSGFASWARRALRQVLSGVPSTSSSLRARPRRRYLHAVLAMV